MSWFGNALKSVGGWITGEGAGLVSGAINAYGQYQSMKEYNRGQMELAKYQNEWNLAQWNRENEYNSPLQQMARYQEAGLNPNLIYGQQNLSAASPAAATPNLKPNNWISKLANLSSIAQLKLTQQQIKNQEADSKLKLAQEGYYNELTRNVGAKTEGQSIFNTMYGNDQVLSNYFARDNWQTNMVDLENQEKIGRYSAFFPARENGVERPSYYNLVYYGQKAATDYAEKHARLYGLYGENEWKAKIYNLINGNLAQQMSAKASLLSANVAYQALGFQKYQYENIKEHLIRKYGADADQAFWNAVYAQDKVFGLTPEQKLAVERLSVEQTMFAVDKVVGLLGLGLKALK